MVIASSANGIISRRSTYRPNDKVFRLVRTVMLWGIEVIWLPERLSVAKFCKEV